MNRKCFVLMPFSTQFDGIWLSVIKPTIQELNDECYRVDDFFNVGSILNDIFKSIHSADYILADLTIQNPNVYYELGYAHAINKRVILITQDISTLPFDLKHQRVILYDDSAAGAGKLKLDLKRFINEI